MKTSSRIPFLKPVKVKVERTRFPRFSLQRKRGRPPRPQPHWLKTLPDGREILDLSRIEAWREYRVRVRQMLDRQEGICCLARACPFCPGKLRLEDAVFEPQYGRGLGGAKRDHRIARDGQPLNGAAHEQCHRWKGSRWVDYERPGAE